MTTATAATATATTMTDRRRRPSGNGATSSERVASSSSSISTSRPNHSSSTTTTTTTSPPSLSGTSTGRGTSGSEADEGRRRSDRTSSRSSSDSLSWSDRRPRTPRRHDTEQADHVPASTTTTRSKPAMERGSGAAAAAAADRELSNLSQRDLRARRLRHEQERQRQQQQQQQLLQQQADEQPKPQGETAVSPSPDNARQNSLEPTMDAAGAGLPPRHSPTNHQHHTTTTTTSISTSRHVPAIAVSAAPAGDSPAERRLSGTKGNAATTTTTTIIDAPVASKGWSTIVARRQQANGSSSLSSSSLLSTSQTTIIKENGLDTHQATTTSPTNSMTMRDGIRSVTPETGATAAAGTTTTSSSSSSSKVNQYLAQRKKKSSERAEEAILKKESSIDDDDSSNDDCSISDLDNEENDDSDNNNSEMSSEDGDQPEWSVRVCVVSAVDFPANVVPNLPFSPLLRLALVTVPPLQATATKAITGQPDWKPIRSQMESHGILSLPKARVRSTTAKVLSKRDNGAVEFHEEMRWDGVKHPQETALAIQLSSRAVMAPRNIKESPPAHNADTPRLTFASSVKSNAAGRSASPTGEDANGGNAGTAKMSGIGKLFRRTPAKGKTEMETANAAAAVAKLLVEGPTLDAVEGTSGGGSGSMSQKLVAQKTLAGNQSELDVKLRPRKRHRHAKLTEDLHIGSQMIPLPKIPLQKVLAGEIASARIEQWFELENSSDATATTKSNSMGSLPAAAGVKRNPSVLLEITFSSAEALDDSEDEDDDDDNAEDRLKASFSKRASQQIRSQLKQEVVQKEEPTVDEEPELVPGVIDFVCVVGARDVGDQKADDGASGWVNSNPECCILEQFPEDDFHVQHGRMATLPNKVEWFCFPEGCRIWRGTTPPNLDELNLKRFSASSPANIATSIASFDACLGCTTSFSWFVISSNSDEYGSESQKTFGAVIRFYVPAPKGIDPTQDDFAQTFIDPTVSDTSDIPEGKRFWVPIGICLTSSIPIVGTMEVILLRLCEMISLKGTHPCDLADGELSLLNKELVNVILSYQRPMAGVVNCSIPFLAGERLHLCLPPRGGLPPLPHGSAVSSLCRLFGADGFNFILAAFLSECKILLHSDDIANLSLVAEVMAALIYPFQWSLPYIPILPLEMVEFLEAPLPFLVGMPSANMKHVDPSLLDDIVVVDLDRDVFGVEFIDSNGIRYNTKTPNPLPASMASNISKAVYRLLRAEEEADENSHNVPKPGAQLFPRLEPESLAEREFRVAVAIEVCGLLRGYQDCLVYAASSQPVFNTDRFLQIAPALFEEQRGAGESPQKVLSPRSRRFMSCLVNCQHFHQFLEVLESDQTMFFREVMACLDTNNVGRRTSKRSGHVLSLDYHKSMEQLSTFLQKMEDKVPMYRVHRPIEITDEDLAEEKILPGSRFPRDLLQQISILNDSQDSGTGDGGVQKVSMEYLVELEKNPWCYQKLFDIDIKALQKSGVVSTSKVKLRDAIGERRYQAWKLALEQEKFDVDEASVMSDEGDGKARNDALDLNSLLTSATADLSSISSDGSANERPDTRHETALTSSQRRLADAKDREVLRRCLEKAFSPNTTFFDPMKEKGRNLVAEAEAALRNPSARSFLLTVLSKRASQSEESAQDRRRAALASGASKLENTAFEVLLRLGCATLDACMEDKDYNSAYSVLKLTAGIYTITGENDNDVAVSYMTGRMGLHPIFADLGVWERAKQLHMASRINDKKVETESSTAEKHDEEDDEYEAAVATLYEMLGYGIPAEELARFASRVSEQNKWFQSEKGQTLMHLARRLSVRREQGADTSGSPQKRKSDIELMSPTPVARKLLMTECAGANGDRSHRRNITVPDSGLTWIETGWCHPAAQSSRRFTSTEKSRRTGTQSLLNMLDEQKVLPNAGGRQNMKHMKRSAITAMAYLGSSVVVTGGLDGGVFMARRINAIDESEEYPDGIEPYCVRGVHLDWGSSGSRYSVGSPSSSLDGEYGVGAVTCLAATHGSSSSYNTLALNDDKLSKDVAEPLDDEDLLESMEGCRVVAGTTCGDLRVWSIKDVYSAVFYSNRDGDGSNQVDPRTIHQSGEGVTSKFVSNRRKVTTDFAAGSSLTRLKFSLRGRALSGHRGGVSCIDVPSSIYRPDSIISGGADGLIKLWSLRSPGTGGRRVEVDHAGQVPAGIGRTTPAKAAPSGDALNIMSGHGGRVLCVKTAWHGDRLLSGGADRTVRVWDLSSSGGKCLHSLSGHLGWVTNVQYWGPNTIISASTDRSIALWDARVRASPLFMLRHHYAPVSDLLVGSRTNPIMISSAGDGTVAAWDFRHLAGSCEGSKPSQTTKKKGQCTTVRDPAGRLYVHDYTMRKHVCGPVLLSEGPSRERKTVLFTANDAIIREWDYQKGEVVSEHVTGHCDTISKFESLQADKLFDTQIEGNRSNITGTITTSWDGTVRIRNLVRKF